MLISKQTFNLRSVIFLISQNMRAKIWVVRRKALLTYFGSLRRLRAATVEDIADVPGFGPTLAQAVHEAVADTGSEAINLTTGEVLDN